MKERSLTVELLISQSYQTICSGIIQGSGSDEASVAESVPANFHLILILLEKAKGLSLTLYNQALKEQAEERGVKHSVKQSL